MRACWASFIVTALTPGGMRPPPARGESTPRGRGWGRLVHEASRPARADCTEAAPTCCRTPAGCCKTWAGWAVRQQSRPTTHLAPKNGNPGDMLHFLQTLLSLREV